MKIETKDDFAQALERLRRRDPEVLAAFILSLVQNAVFPITYSACFYMMRCLLGESQAGSAFEGEHVDVVSSSSHGVEGELHRRAD